MKKQKICIIGGGLTGLVAALVLSRSGANVDLFVGKKSHQASKLVNARSIGISKSNYDFLLNYNFFNKFKKKMWQINEIKIYEDFNNNMREILNFEKNELMYMINYSLFVNFLQKEVSKKMNMFEFKVIWSKKKITAKFSTWKWLIWKSQNSSLSLEKI